MAYQPLFAIHLAAVATFVAILLLTALMLPRLTPPDAGRLRTMNLYVASPALALVWMCGIGMALEAGWFAMIWLRVKIVLVLLLSAAHGRQLKALRTRVGAEGGGSYWPLVIEAAAFVLIVGLAVAKPA